MNVDKRGPACPSIIAPRLICVKAYCELRALLTSNGRSSTGYAHLRQLRNLAHIAYWCRMKTATRTLAGLFALQAWHNTHLRDTRRFARRNMSRISVLARLQTIDQEIDDKTKRARQVEDLLSSNPVVASARAALSTQENELAGLRSKLRLRESDAKLLDDKIREMEIRLYGGHVQNPKELDGLEKERQMLKRQRSQMDDQLLELMESIDQAQNRVQAGKSSLQTIEGTRTQDVDRLNHERSELEKRLRSLAGSRDQLRTSLDTDSLRIYDQLRRTKAGRSVAILRQGACTACGVAVPTGLMQRVGAGDEIVFCSGCGRILAS